MYSYALEAQAEMLRHVRKLISTPLGISSESRLDEHLYKGALNQYQPALKQMQLSLETAAPFWWDPDLCSVLEATAPTMPDWELRVERLPAVAGYVLFGRPLALPQPAVETIKLAIENGRRSRDIPLDYRMDMVGMLWHVVPDGVFLATILRTTWRSQGEPGLMHITDEGVTLSEILATLANTRRNDPDYNSQSHDLIMARRAELQARYIAAALDFVNQPLLTVRKRMPADRATRKRAQREGRGDVPDVQVIELRRKQYLTLDEPDEAPTDREYRHRWMVGMATGGYWQRYHTGVGRTETIRRLVLPYMKLADRTDLPIKAPRSTVYVVDR
jgi:hypothetical protein